MENGAMVHRQILVLNRNMGEVDLLQQALANATDETSEGTNGNTILSEDLDQNALLSILQNQEEHIQTQTIQLTAEQAAELGLQLETEPEDYVNDKVDKKNVTPIVRNSGPTPIPAVAAQVISQLNINTNKPLGTIKNPIQLIKQGDSFVSVQELDQNQLQELETALLQKTPHVSQKNGLQNVHYDPKSNTRIVYRTVYPEELDLQTPRRGKNKRGRPRKGSVVEKPDSPPTVSVAKPVRTRSGRLTKPPKHIENNYRPDIIEEGAEENEINNVNQLDNKIVQKSVDNTQPFDNLKNKTVSFEPTYLPALKRNIASQYRCPTCKKAYLGYSRMERHIKLHPDHGPMPLAPPRITPLWDTAVRSARTSLPGNRGITLLNELSNLIKTVQEKCVGMLQPANEISPQVEIDDNLGLLLKMPAGKYSIDENIVFEKQNLKKNINGHEFKNDTDNSMLESRDNNDSQSLQEQLLNVQIVPNVENDETHELILTVDTGQVPMVLDSNGTSEEVMNVDQLVSERLQSLTAAELAPPSSNTSLNLDLSLDLYPFHPS